MGNWCEGLISQKLKAKSLKHRPVYAQGNIFRQLHITKQPANQRQALSFRL